MYATPLAISVVILWHLLAHQATAKNDLELQFVNFTCTRGSHPNANLLASVNCGLSKNPKRRTLNMEFVLVKPLDVYDFDIVIVLPRRTQKFVVLNVTTDGCQLLSNKNQVTLLRIIREILDRYSNFPKHCPLKQDKAYNMRGFRLDLSLIPAVTIETPVYVEFSYISKQVVLFTGYIAASVQQISDKKNKKGA
ncbi:uncharacterized protein LOC6560011 [Drosophila grimshawi]|uniref:GH21739 n=1 Tax=Drosophila grimshawi TaxID=7222 RepID=B4J6I0_DROGR|nr:uncharacterized protein LOC6560011 [Drosophila grimshawi]EDW01981.1 GH21739 [Drosophila grimshawi]